MSAHGHDDNGYELAVWHSGKTLYRTRFSTDLSTDLSPVLRIVENLSGGRLEAAPDNWRSSVPNARPLPTHLRVVSRELGAMLGLSGYATALIRSWGVEPARFGGTGRP